ncbi:MAG: DNA/RNA non-specific endonuclease [Prevotella sp.]|nr:DNA/RNA non-specific endonuclease [Prevotella sp.]
MLKSHTTSWAFAALLLLLSATGCRQNKGDSQSLLSVVSPETGSLAVAASGTSSSETSGKPSDGIVEYELPAPLKDRPELILHRTGYTVSYNSKTKNPNWVAWHLTKNRIYGSAKRAEEAFQEDASVPSPRAALTDYYNTGFDRGHMCPAADNKWNATAMAESFLLTNVCPQHHGLNKYEWNDVEIRCRLWAKTYGAVDIVCGPIYKSDPPKRTLGRNKVWVPDAFFKVVLCRKGTPKAIGFVYDNVGKKMSMAEHVYTVDEIEAMTGIDFFPALDDKVEKLVESEARLSDWE